MDTARKNLSDLRGADLRALHASGSCPDPGQLRGVLDGAVLTGQLAAPGVKALRAWRGKAFDPPTGASKTVSGVNRLGVGPMEFRRFRFTARVGQSSFADRAVVLLDHDQDGNPAWVRRFHDELVEVADGLYLATSHHRAGDRYRFLAYFALASA